MNPTENYRETDITPGPAVLFDLSTVEQLCRGNVENLRKMVLVFVKTISASIEEMKTAHDNGDAASLRKIAHRIRPALAVYAVTGVEKEILSIELDQPDENELGFMVTKVGQVVSEVVTQLKKQYLIA